MEAWQFLLFCSERYKSLDMTVKGKASGHSRRRWLLAVSTPDSHPRLLMNALAEKQKESVQIEASGLNLSKAFRKIIIHGTNVGGNVAEKILCFKKRLTIF
jgi:hypothetical protein